MSVLILHESGKTLEKSLRTIFKKFMANCPKNIFIKPNLSGRPPIKKSENTDFNFLDKLIKVLLDDGCQRIVIGHSSLLGTPDRVYPFENIIKFSGFDKFYKYSKVELLNLDNCKRRVIQFENDTFSIPEIIYQSEFYLNLAKLKTHMETVVSLSLKNQMGLLAQEDRVIFHQSGLEQKIAHLAIVKPTLNIIDGIWAMEANGPHHGVDKKVDLVFAGDDMVEIDSLVCEIIGIDYRLVKHIYLAGQLGVGKFIDPNFSDKYPKKKIRPANSYIKIGRKIYVWPTTSCSRCIMALSEGGKLHNKNLLRAIKFASKAYLSKDETNIIIGRGDGVEIGDDKNFIAIGKCAQEFADKNNIECLSNCPSSAEDVFKYLTKKI